MKSKGNMKMIKALKIVRNVSEYIAGLLVMLGIMVACFAGATEDIEAIKIMFFCGLAVMSGAIPFSLVWALAVEILDRWGADE